VHRRCARLTTLQRWPRTHCVISAAPLPHAPIPVPNVDQDIHTQCARRAATTGKAVATTASIVNTCTRHVVARTLTKWSAMNNKVLLLTFLTWRRRVRASKTLFCRTQDAIQFARQSGQCIAPRRKVALLFGVVDHATVHKVCIVHSLHLRWRIAALFTRHERNGL